MSDIQPHVDDWLDPELGQYVTRDVTPEQAEALAESIRAGFMPNLLPEEFGPLRAVLGDVEWEAYCVRHEESWRRLREYVDDVRGGPE